MLSTYLLHPVTVVTTTTALVAAYLYLRRPGMIIKYITNFMMYRSGLRVKSVTAGQYTYCYAERGNPNPARMSMFMIHGFTGNKTLWLPLLKRLPSDIHIVVVDLPGHGDTTIPDEEQDISVARIVDNIHEFAHAIGLDRNPFHMIGSSLGGAMVALYSSLHAPEVGKLSVMCPPVSTAVETDFMRKMREGSNLLVPRTTQAMQEMMNVALYRQQNYNQQVLLGILQLREAQNDFFERMSGRLQDELVEMNNNDHKYQQHMVKVTSPTQIIWGKNDEIIHVSGADTLRKHLKNCVRVDLLDCCGHYISLEQPQLFSKTLLEFYQEESH